MIHWNYIPVIEKVFQVAAKNRNTWKREFVAQRI